MASLSLEMALSSNTAPNRLIFIVDDDPDDRQIIEDAFRENNPKRNYVFLESSNALLDRLAGDGDQPDLILLDLNMPGTSGIQALKQIRGNKRFMQIPIIVMTTSISPKDSRSAYEYGANCFLTKPDSYQKMLSLIGAISLLWL